MSKRRYSEILLPDKRFKRDIWDTFNEYRNPCPDPWVSGTGVKNFLLNDPIIDYLGHVNKTTKSKSDSSLSLLFEMGIKFETDVINLIKKRYPVVKIVNSRDELNESSFQRTVTEIHKGTPIIEQAVLINDKNKTRGVADLLIRSDYFHKLFKESPIDYQEAKFKAPCLKEFHYRVIDIKWSNMNLCSDGRLIRNSDLYPAYKGQLAIYNAALGLIQGFTPNQAYILGKSWKYNKGKEYFEGYNCFDRLGVIDYTDFDSDYLIKTQSALEWIRNMRMNWSKWDIEKPHIPELMPNMNNTYDYPFHHIKVRLSEKNKELTQVYMVGVKNRNLAIAAGVKRYTDTKCNSEIMGLYGPKVSPLIDNILKVNRGKRSFYPEKIINCSPSLTQRDSEFFVDFETMNGSLFETDPLNSKEINGIIFMIGIGKFKESWDFKSLSMETYSIPEEARVVQEMIDTIPLRSTIYHWGHAEFTGFRSCNSRHKGRWTEWYDSIEWIDLCEVFKTEPILIKGATKFGLKEISKYMRLNGMINVNWEDSLDGFSAMIKAIRYYKNKSQEDIENFKKIIRYNEVDCKSVQEILYYLRTKL